MVVSRERVKAYYEEHFNTLDLVRVINIQKDDFARREFAWATFPDVDGGKFRRNVRYDNLESFKENIIKVIPYKLYFGAVYEKKWEKSIIGTPWERNEIHFDIDVNESELSRKKICDCGKSEKKEEKKKVCDKCFEIVKEAAIFLIETLHEDFGMDKKGAMIYFSGTRGIHIHYPKFDALGMDEEDDKEIRRNLINYISLVNESEVKTEDDKKDIVAKIDGLMGAKSLVRRANKYIYNWFFLKGPEDIIKKIRMNDAARNLIIKELKNGLGIDEIFENYAMKSQASLLSSHQIVNMREKVLSYRYPRYDGTPTYDVRKVIKVPLSIDCNTGYVVTRISNLDGFSLGDVDHLNNYVK